ncbi:30 kDa heat shock protein [Exophiala viscosa]|uniref:30 kDa heat shock protein n=1 Tax=Exophiala viscosa TaxID=2486360 RepID=A0AAN6DXB5_9EURO|nr:30 kDa heat shock protein [Exophiala viscosa]
MHSTKVLIPQASRTIIRQAPLNKRKMSFLFPRIAFTPARCGPARHDLAPLFSLFDDTINELQRATQQPRRQFTPRFDLKETKDAYSLEGELPGVEQQNLNIEFTDEHTLRIKGRTERHTESGQRPQAAVESEKKAAIEEAQSSETSSVKSHQPTVEDEEPVLVDSSAASEENSEVVAPEPAPVAEQPKTEPAQPEQQYWVSERSVGEFTRSFNFPARVNQDAVRASLKNGILSILVPKAQAPASRRINIE